MTFMLCITKKQHEKEVLQQCSREHSENSSKQHKNKYNMIEHIALMKVREGHYLAFCRNHPKMLEDMLKASEEKRKTLFRNFEYALMELLMQEEAIMKVMEEKYNDETNTNTNR